MKKGLLIISVALIMLSGCGGPEASDDSCLYCGKKPAYIYEMNGQDIILCNDCYKIELELDAQYKADLISEAN